MKIAKNWNEISIGQFQQINTALKNYPDNAITQAVWMLNALTGIPREELLVMDFSKDFKTKTIGLRALAKSWKSGSEADKFGNQEFVQGSLYENDNFQAVGPNLEIWL